ncbi:helicase RepA family protein [Pseudomonas hormoni]
MNIDLLAAFETPPPMLDFIWPGFLAGTVGALIAPGATGKSYWALEAAMGVACSVAGGDVLDLCPSKAGKVLYIAGEDPAPALIRRVHAIGQHLDQPARKSIADELTLSTVMGEPFNVMETSHYRALIEQALGYRLIVLDTLSRIHQLDENSNSDMSQLISRLEQVAATTGASVLFLHHVSKGSAREGLADQQQAARGASSLIDNARWCGYVAGMTEEESKRLTERPYDRVPIGTKRRFTFVRFGVSKQNYDPTDLERWYCRQSGGVLMPVSLTDADTSKNGRRLRDEA